MLACVCAGIAMCSSVRESVNRSVFWSEYGENGVSDSYLTSAEYRTKLAEMYEQLCILGLCELANSNENMDYVGNKYVMSDFLYYLDYNQYKYKKTEEGVFLVSDMFDYYVSYTKPASLLPVSDEILTDEETTDGETSGGETAEAEEQEIGTETAEGTTLFVTNINENLGSMDDGRRLMYLQNRFSNYLLRSEDVMSSDMTSSGYMIYYNYRAAEDGKLTDILTENYPSNFLPLGGWYYDNYGRYVFNFGNDFPIVFYRYPDNTEAGRKARQDYIEVAMPDYDEVELYYDGYYDNDGRFYAELPIEEMEDYEAHEGETSGLTVFIAPKADLLENRMAAHMIAKRNYTVAHFFAVVFKLLTVLLTAYLLAAAAVLGLCGETGSAVARKIPPELYALAFVMLGVYILDDYRYGLWNVFGTPMSENTAYQAGDLLYVLVGGLLVSGELLMGMHMVTTIFARQLKQRLATPKLTKKLLAKYRSTGLYREQQKRTAGQKLKGRTVRLFVAAGITLFFAFLMFAGSYWDFDWLVLILVVITGGIFIYNQVMDLLLSRELGKLERRISALGRNEIFEEKVSEDSDIYSEISTLDHISETIDNAVDDRIKSERMKIELVANVSHDLKTPLTSIISYIDLLKKTELNDEARDYVQILDKKSQKLKGIVSDVFSLAKATSGIDVNMEELDFITLFNQSLADSEDKIKNSGKIVKVMVKEKTAPILGDGNKLYRVFQNIIDNALKYSMEGSRIFLDVERVGDDIVFTAKNISSYPIDFSADEITERFVRGDKSRTDGGSGLGLSIAKSFTEACGGRFDIELDGDMFKAITAMPLRSHTL